MESYIITALIALLGVGPAWLILFNFWQYLIVFALGYKTSGYLFKSYYQNALKAERVRMDHASFEIEMLRAVIERLMCKEMTDDAYGNLAEDWSRPAGMHDEHLDG